ncbi:MAG: thiamine-phosphate kinase [Clostridia bacterium]|nr:thiamine-phosphate kinase [Clostridia bacterium]
MKIKDIGEFGFIKLINKGLINNPEAVVQGIGDDTAVLAPSGKNQLLFTTDMMVEEVHFSLRYATYRQVGHKALAVNLSDIAAMGGKPTHAVVSLGVPPERAVEDLQELYRGMADLAARFGVNIVGGDTVKTAGQLVINVALLGEVAPGRAIYRSGAEEGDYILVTGTLGDSAAGLYLFQNQDVELAQEIGDTLRKRHLEPEPRLDIGPLLAETGLVTAINDISDGLAREISEICEASGVGCRLIDKKIPISEEARVLGEITGHSPVEWALNGGEDFQLVFTVEPDGLDEIEETLRKRGVAYGIVGVITSLEQGIGLVTEKGIQPLAKGGYDHFSG